MSLTGSAPPAASPPGVDVPVPYRVVDVLPEGPEVATLHVVPEDRRPPDFLPAQFSMIGVPGLGEVPISISTPATETTVHGYTIRRSGAVSRALVDRRPGDLVTVRGPFGRPWDLDAATGRDVVVVAGGIGIAPLRAAIHALVDRRDRIGRISVCVGAVEPSQLLFRPWLDSLVDCGVQVLLTVDRCHPAVDGWLGRVGFVTEVLRDLVRSPEVAALVCGPDAMMRVAIAELRRLGVPSAQIQLTLERNMLCGVGWCGHCQLGRRLVCRHGPVVTAAELGRDLDIEEW